MLVLKTRRQKLERVVFSPDGGGIAAAGQLGAWWWKSFRDDPKPVRFGETDSEGVGFTPDGEYLLATASNIGLRCVRLSGQSEHVLSFRDFDPLLGVCPATGLAVVGSVFSDKLSGWRVGPDGRLARAWEVKAERGSIGSFVAFPADGAWFVRAAEVRDRWPPFRLLLHEPATGEVFRDIPAQSWVSCTPAVSADGSRVAYGSQHFLYGHWTAKTRRPVAATNDSTHQFTGVAFHPSGQYLAAANNDGTVKLYDATSWKVARTFTWDIGRVRSVAFSPDGTLAAAGSDSGKVVVWDVDL
jgi:WD40 repeat protein